ncbi:MAG: hypothetical protein IJ754_06775 [Bacteroidaceae bacterium]|nr:hypothetical protein [Bacteroidaceae bacterium]
MKLQTIYKGLALMTLSLALASCMDKEWDTPDTTRPAYGNNSIEEVEAKLVTIDQLKTTYGSVINASGFQRITDDLQLKCTVIGNDIGGNIYKQICVQDATGAMIVGINGTGLFPFLSVGQQILINLKDLCIGGYGQQTQLGDEYNGSIGRMSTSKWEDHVRILPSHDMSQIDTIDFYNVAKSDMARYCGHLVCLKDVQIGDADGTTTLAPEYTSGTTLTYNGSTNGYVHHTLNGESMNTLLLRTSTYADFAALVIPQKPITLYGIATRYRNTWQILIRAEEDIKIDK